MANSNEPDYKVIIAALNQAIDVSEETHELEELILFRTILEGCLAGEMILIIELTDEGRRQANALNN